MLKVTSTSVDWSMKREDARREDVLDGSATRRGRFLLAQLRGESFAELLAFGQFAVDDWTLHRYYLNR
jgi:hypothetical protein